MNFATLSAIDCNKQSSIPVGASNKVLLRLCDDSNVTTAYFRVTKSNVHNVSLDVFVQVFRSTPMNFAVDEPSANTCANLYPAHLKSDRKISRFCWSQPRMDSGTISWCWGTWNGPTWDKISGDDPRRCCLQRFRTETAGGVCTPWYESKETCIWAVSAVCTLSAVSALHTFWKRVSNFFGIQLKPFERKMKSFVTNANTQGTWSTQTNKQTNSPGGFRFSCWKQDRSEIPYLRLQSH